MPLRHPRHVRRTTRQLGFGVLSRSARFSASSHLLIPAFRSPERLLNDDKSQGPSRDFSPEQSRENNINRHILPSIPPSNRKAKSPKKNSVLSLSLSPSESSEDTDHGDRKIQLEGKRVVSLRSSLCTTALCGINPHSSRRFPHTTTRAIIIYPLIPSLPALYSKS